MPIRRPAPRPVLAAGIIAVSLLGQLATGWIVPLLLRIPGIRAVDFVLGTAIVQVAMTVVVPYALAWATLGLTPARLGVTHRGLARGLLLGIALYALAMAAFVTFCAADPGIAGHLVRRFDGERLLILATGMCLIAAGTDLATRGFILLGVAEYTPVWFAVLMQNVFWLWGHKAEILKLSGPQCLGLPGAIALFVALGVLGDVVALRSRNVVGLAIGHILLNLAMIAWIRAM
jgi:hypothetical protein